MVSNQTQLYHPNQSVRWTPEHLDIEKVNRDIVSPKKNQSVNTRQPHKLNDRPVNSSGRQTAREPARQLARATASSITGPPLGITALRYRYTVMFAVTTTCYELALPADLPPATVLHRICSTATKLEFSYSRTVIFKVCAACDYPTTALNNFHE
ncbi:hypothetical protein E2C01_045720 [Portunus trituberculatus]|uniref:Uncharacterized protein n=1 Tax=Portunus trituberculatus TaxID=210409 RepID=A0A5B7G250_PORTR|nr:hypothetical protein [Portunus trituberculatus]